MMPRDIPPVGIDTKLNVSKLNITSLQKAKRNTAQNLRLNRIINVHGTIKSAVVKQLRLRFATSGGGIPGKQTVLWVKSSIHRPDHEN